MIDSINVPPQVKPIFQRLIVALNEAKPCVDQANIQCLLKSIRNDGLKSWEQGEKLSHGKLKELFQTLANLDRIAIKIISTLPKDAGEEAVYIANIILITKANEVHKYLGY